MATITIKINNKNYPIDCDDPIKLQELAFLLEEKVQHIKHNFNNSLNTEMLYLFTLLMLQEDIISLNKSTRGSKDISLILDDVSDYIEKITNRL